MTFDMILALGILIFMIVLIMLDKLPFGAPPLLACFLLVISGLTDMATAFQGFANKSVIMIAGFMIVMNAIQKTSLIEKVKKGMIKMVNTGGYKSYVILMIIVMLGTSLVGGGNTGYYVLILSLIATIPYSKVLPTSKLMLPLGFATNHPLIPFNVALYFGVAASVLESIGWTGGMSMAKFAVANFFMSAAFLVWCLVAYKLLPDHPIAGPSDEDVERSSEEFGNMPKWQENLTIVLFVISVVGMMLINTLPGEIAYAIPGVCGFILLAASVVNFKEVRESMWAPVIIMMAGVIGVAEALAATGFTAMVGEKMAGVMDGSPAFLVILVFALLTSTAATFTGSNMGSVYIFAPLAGATVMAMGLNPLAAVAACTVAGWQGGYMPIDGLPALILGMGNYKMTEFWKFTVPMYFIRIIFLTLGCLIMFPMSA